MKVVTCRLIRAASMPVVGAALVSALLAGCGDKESNPDAVSVSELKYPGNLKIWDKGNGSVALSWTGSNNEEDFDGYNVYGMKGTATPDSLGVTEGKALELLDDAGEPTTAKDVLAKFNYDPEKGLEAAGTTVNDDGEVEFSALPIHSKAADGSRLLPTCKASGSTCTDTTAATKEITAGTNPAYAVNGKVTYTVPKALTVGESYCFLVLSSMDGGTTVSQTSSNAECVIPNYKVGFDIDLPTAQSENLAFDLAGWLTACGTAGSCATPVDTDYLKAEDKTHRADDTLPVYVDSGSSGAGWVAGKNSAVIDLGYYEAGFDDETLPASAPALALDTDTFKSDNVDTPVFNGGGYSLAGQTVPIEAKHVYVIAVGDSEATGALTSFHYHWVYVSAVANGKATVEFRLSKNAK